METMGEEYGRIVQVYPSLIIVESLKTFEKVTSKPKSGVTYNVGDKFEIIEFYSEGQVKYCRLGDKLFEEQNIVDESHFFESRNDMIQFVEHYHGQLEKFISDYKDSSEFEIDSLETNVEYLFEIFNEIKSEVKNVDFNEQSILKLFEVKNFVCENGYEDIRKIFEYLDDEVYQIIHEKAEKYNLNWKSWRNSIDQTFFSGYNQIDFLNSHIKANSILQQHFYRRPPQKLRIPCIEIVQKSKKFYIGKMEVRMIAQSSLVPSLDDEISIFDASKRVLNSDYKSNEWQRQADRKRITRIQNFIEDSDSIIANSPMLFIRDPNSAYFQGNELIVDFSKFLVEVNHAEYGTVFTDFTTFEQGSDRKPIWIVDGQHRVLGIHRSRKNDVEIPVVIFPHNFGSPETAKIFAEINTYQVKLNSLHEIFMQHRFKLGHTKNNRRFNDIYSFSLQDADLSFWKREWLDSRANHMSYEIASMLAVEGPLIDRIQILVENSLVNKVINAEQFINYTRKYFLKEPYGIAFEEFYMSERKMFDRKHIQLKYYSEILNYFSTFETLYQKSNWPSDEVSRWSGKIGNRRPLIVRETFFQILLEIYPLVHRLARTRQISLDPNSEELTLEVKHFYNVLKPLKNVDWLHSDIIDFFKGGGEKPRRSLEVWIADCILNCNSVSTLVEILDKTIKSVPGKGLTAPLAPPEVISMHNGMYKNAMGDMEFHIRRPFNARYEGRWTLSHDGIEIKSGAIKHEKYTKVDIAKFFLHHKYFEAEKTYELKIQYFNMSDTISGQVLLNR